MQAEREDYDEEEAAGMHGDDRPRCRARACPATRDVRRACGRATKHPGKGVLHDLPRGDDGLRRT